MIYKKNVITLYIQTMLFVITLYTLFLAKGYALSFDTPLVEGQLAYGHMASDEKAYINVEYLNVGDVAGELVEVMRTPEGRFVIGIPQDKKRVVLFVETPEKREKVEFPVQARQWHEEIVNGLPAKKVTPHPADQERITAEALQMRQIRGNPLKTSAFPDKWIRPVRSFKRISSAFGSRRLLNGVKTQGHSGTDYAAPAGTPILAPAAGVVRLIHPDMFYSGQTILIDHGFGVFSSYSHLSRTDVTENQEVRAGDVIGAVGTSGRSTGPHLHWTVTWYGVRVDPETVVNE